MGYAIKESHIGWYRMRTQLAALKLEMAGLKRSGRSMFKVVKTEYGLTGTISEVYKKFGDMVEQTRPD